MPDDITLSPERPLADALRALPLEQPDRSAWPALAARIAEDAPTSRRPARPRWLLGLAAAAALGAIALMPRDLVRVSGGTPPTAVAAVAAAPAGVDDLMAESARLEYLLEHVGGDMTGSASATALALEYEARVQQIDAALSDPALTPPQRAALWQRRVDLLRDYAGVNGTAQWLAAQGRDFDGDLVAVF